MDRRYLPLVILRGRLPASGEYTLTPIGEKSTVASFRITRQRLLSIVALSLMVSCGAFFAVAMCLPGSGEDATLDARTMTTIDSFTASPSTAYVGEEVTFVATASSGTGTQLTFTFYYDAIDYPYPTNNTESPYSVHTTSNPGTVTTTFTYDRLGNLTSGSSTYYVVRLIVSDGVESKSMTKTVYVIQNTAPSFVTPPSATYTLLPDQQVDITISVIDSDNDPVTVTWNFGDGTTVVNSTGDALTAQQVRQSHAWSPDIGPGMGPVLYYSLTVTLEDPYSNTRVSTSVVGITLPYNGLPVVMVTASANTVDPDEEVTFFANATDPEGEALTWTYVINNSIEDIAVFVSHTETTSPGVKVWNNLTYAFPDPGSYNVRLYVSDALIPYQIAPHNVTKSVQVYVIGNAVPSAGGIDMSESTPIIDTAVGSLSVTFMIEVYDNDGEVLTVTWDMDDDGDPLVNVSAGGMTIYTFRQVRVFTEPGAYNISLTVTDGIAGHEVSVFRLVNVSTNNRPPNVLELDFTYTTGDFGLPDEEIQFTLTLSDPEMDTLEVTWDFGDNTSIMSFNLTEYVDGVTRCVVNHSYAEAGTFNLTITYTDNKIGELTHNRVKYVVVTIDEIYVRPAENWSWWDYATLTAVIATPIAFVLFTYVTYLRRKRIESEGLSWQEMKLKESETLDASEDDYYVEVD